MTHDESLESAYQDVVRELRIYTPTFLATLSPSERSVALSRCELLEEQLHELAEEIDSV